MGCINGKSLLREEDLNYIARNTAMDKEAVEVHMLSGLIFVLSIQRNFDRHEIKVLSVIHYELFRNIRCLNNSVRGRTLS